MRYALVDPKGNVDRIATDVDPTVPTRSGWRWLPCPVGEKPTIDPTTHKIDGPIYAVGETEVTERYSAVGLTAQEIDDAKSAAVAGMNGSWSPFLRVILNHENRIRALEGKNSITMAQLKAALKALL
jgi:hypothetical protein